MKGKKNFLVIKLLWDTMTALSKEIPKQLSKTSFKKLLGLQKLLVSETCVEFSRWFRRALVGFPALCCVPATGLFTTLPSSAWSAVVLRFLMPQEGAFADGRAHLGYLYRIPADG